MNNAFVEQIEYLGSGVESNVIELGDAVIALYDYATLFGYPVTLLHTFTLLRSWRTARAMLYEAEKNWHPSPGKRTEVWDCVTAPYTYVDWEDWNKRDH